MKKGYWVVAYRSISDESAPKAYAELAVPALQPFGARFLTMRSSKVYPQESGLQQGTVVVEFDSYETALAAYESEAYKKALHALGSGAERDFRIVEGVWCIGRFVTIVVMHYASGQICHPDNFSRMII